MVPTWPKLSTTPWRLNGTDTPASMSADAHASPRPPMTPWFSNVTTAFLPAASLRSRSTSSGFTQNMSMTSAEMPCSSRDFAASIASFSSWPCETTSTSVPCLMTLPLPSSNVEPSAYTLNEALRPART